LRADTKAHTAHRRLLPVALLLATCFFALGAHTTFAAESLLNKNAPEFSRTAFNGARIDLAGFRGKVVLLDFWATWCPPCRAEIPHLVDLSRELKPKGLRILGLSVDQNGPALVKGFMNNFGINYPVMLCTPAIAQAYGGIDGIPATFLLGKHGELLGHWVGYTDAQVFKDAIKAALAK
jgi:cytochrome c biogenesis protein CcmG/thiol:disulfide interchange protein DsbE